MTKNPINAPPLLFDLDEDGDLEIAVGDNNGRFYIWSLLGDTSLVWGQYLHDPANTGRYPDNLLPQMPQPSDSMVKNFYVYPNPAKDEAFIRYWLGKDINKVKIRVFDIAGDPVSKEYIGDNQSLTENEVMLPISSIASGVYLVRLEVANGSKKQVRFYKLAITK